MHPAAFAVAPDVALIFDVTATGDEQSAKPMTVKLGGGVAVKIKPTIITADGESPPEFIQNFLDAAVGLIEGVVKSENAPKEPKCRVCGATWKQIKETRIFGCPDCWSQFAENIKMEFLCGSYGTKHIGKIPEKTHDGTPSRAFLEKELKDAVAKQNYRKAARIKKQLDELEGKGK